MTWTTRIGDVIRIEYHGFTEWEIVLYETGQRWAKWNAKIRRLDRFFSDWHGGDPFGARTAEGARKKALREVKRCDELDARETELWKKIL